MRQTLIIRVMCRNAYHWAETVETWWLLGILPIYRRVRYVPGTFA